MKQLLLSFSIIIILTTCCTTNRGRYDDFLVQIDSLTATHADSARQLLSTLDKQMNKAPQSTQAYYQLLRVKADDKAHIKHTSDSLILTVAQYYRQHPSSGRLPEAYYYVGRVNSELLNGEKALLYFQKALLEDSLHVSTHLKSRIYAQMGYIYQRNGLYDESISLQQLAHYYCQETGDTLGMRCCTENIQAIQAAQQDSLHTPTPNQSEMMLRLQKLNTQVKNQILNSKNTKLERENAIERTLIWIATAALILLTAAILIILQVRKKKRTTDNGQRTTDNKPRQHYDKSIDQLLTSHIINNKALKEHDWRTIEKSVLASFPTFRERLFSLYNFSDTEYRICLLIKLEESPSNIAKLMATGKSAISQNRLRMQQKAFNGKGTAKDWDNFILSL